MLLFLQAMQHAFTTVGQRVEFAARKPGIRLACLVLANFMGTAQLVDTMSLTCLETILVFRNSNAKQS